jgi:hypothetical protein
MVLFSASGISNDKFELPAPMLTANLIQMLQRKAHDLWSWVELGSITIKWPHFISVYSNLNQEWQSFLMEIKEIKVCDTSTRCFTSNSYLMKSCCYVVITDMALEGR